MHKLDNVDSHEEDAPSQSDQLMSALEEKLTVKEADKPFSERENQTLALLILKRWKNDVDEAVKAWNRLMFTSMTAASFARLCYPDND